MFREGKSFALFPFRVYYLADRTPNGQEEASSSGWLQAGFGASSKNFKKAVDRNRIKRLTREAYRLQKQALQDQLKEKNQALSVFFIYVGKELPDQQMVSGKIGSALQKLLKETRS